MGITSDKEGNIWFGDVTHNYIGRYNPKEKKLRRFFINTPSAQPGKMRFNKNGWIWFCQLRTKQLGVFMPDPGIFSTADMPGYNAVPQSVVPADDGMIWFVDSMMNRVGYFDSQKLKWGVFNIPTANSQPMDIILDSKGDIWFTQSDRHANKIARLRRSTVPDPTAISGGAGTSSGGTKKVSSKTQDTAGYTKLIAAILLAIVLGFILFRVFRSRADRA